MQKVCDFIGKSNATANKYARNAGVTSKAKRGQRNFEYTVAETLKILNHTKNKLHGSELSRVEKVIQQVESAKT